MEPPEHLAIVHPCCTRFKLPRQTQIAERERKQCCCYVRVASAPQFQRGSVACSALAVVSMVICPDARRGGERHRSCRNEAVSRVSLEQQSCRPMLRQDPPMKMPAAACKTPSPLQRSDAALSMTPPACQPIANTWSRISEKLCMSLPGKIMLKAFYSGWGHTFSSSSTKIFEEDIP